MVDAGYFAKRVESSPDWLGAAAVHEVCSVSHCVSAGPDGWVERWLHNGLGWFNHASDALEVVPLDQRPTVRLFGYRLYPQFFREGTQHPLALPSDVHPDPIPPAFRLLGFDCVSKLMDSSLGFDCSPLSCNGMATELSTNKYCLFASIAAAVVGATRFSIEQPEPGDYYVVEVLEERAA